MQSESKNEKQELCLHRPAMRIEGAGKEFYVYYMFGCRGSIGTGDLDRICRGKRTRDEPDYDKLMKWRLGVLKEHGLGLKEIQDVIRTIDPLPGAKEFLDELRSFTQVILISDTFTQFASPLMEKLGWPTLFCNSLEVAENGEITGFKMRVEQSKLTTVKALQSIGFDTIASGDSYNDLGMIQASKAGFLFRSTDKIKADYPDIPAYETYEELLSAIRKAMVD